MADEDWFSANAPPQQPEQDWFAQNAPQQQAAVAEQPQQSTSGVGAFFKGLNLASVPLDIVKSLTPALEAPSALKQGYDLLRGVPVEKALPEDYRALVGIEKKPLDERIKTGLDVVTQLAFLKAGVEGIPGFKAPPKLADVVEPLIGKAPETAAQPVEPVATDATKTEPIIPPPNEPTGISQPQIAPSEAQSAEQNLTSQFSDLNTQAADIQAKIDAQRAAQPVPAATEATTSSGIQETGGATTAPLSTETTGEPNAIQEQSASSILQHPQESVGTAGGERIGVEPSVQGETPTGTREGGAPQVRATTPEVVDAGTTKPVSISLLDTIDAIRMAKEKVGAEEFRRITEARIKDVGTTTPAGKSIVTERSARLILAGDFDIKEGSIRRDLGNVQETSVRPSSPEIPEGAKVTLNVRNTAGELRPREMDAKQAEGMFTKEKSSYQALLNCLGA